MKLASRQEAGVFGAQTKLVGVIKEVAPVKGAETDEELGVGVFSNKYFRHPVYMVEDRKQRFKWHELIAAGSILSQGLPTWNPFSLVSGFFKLKDRLKDAKVEGNYAGEGTIKGGVMVIRNGECVWYLREESGSDLPYDEIAEVITGLALSDAEKTIITAAVEQEASHLGTVGQAASCSAETKECSY